MSGDIDYTKLSILIIDDETFMCQLISRVLNEIGAFDIAVAKDGEKGLQRVYEAGARLDIILCDLEMPGMDGFEFVRKLRTSNKAANPNVPVLIVTGHSDEAHIKEAVKSGINGFLVKPISKANLESRMKAALKGVKIDPKILG